MDGIILVNKEKSWTSFDVVAKIRNTLKTKVGHTGTLDPMATGLLVVLLGSARKLEKYLVSDNKTYIVEIKFGIKTDTGDISGTKIQEEEFRLENYTKEEYKSILAQFIGKQMQVPPKYSALKYKGESLHRLAREELVSKEEMEQILESKKREIEVFSIEVIESSLEEKTLKLEISCSSGTYIRTLVEDIAETCFKTIATVQQLHRTRVGIFDINDSYLISDILKLSEENKSFKEVVLEVEKAFSNIPKTRIEESRVYYFANGVRITNKINEGIYRVYSFNKENNLNEKRDKFIGIGVVQDGLMKREYIYED